MALLELKNIVKDFSGVRALDGVSLSLEAGEIHALCGENGAGKSTLLKILAGCHATGSYSGEIFLNDGECRFVSPGSAEKAGIVLVAQELSLVGALTAAENICLGHERGNAWKIDWQETRASAERAMREVGLDEGPDVAVEALSVGKQQMVEIARALNKKARVLILDEPTAALTEADASRLLQLVKAIAAQGTGVLYVSHRLDEIFEIAHRITVLRDGKSVGSAFRNEWSRERVVASMVGRELAEAEKAVTAQAPSKHRALEIKNWSLKRQGGQGLFALKDIALGVDQGEILGIGGLMGSGRTALMSSLFGDCLSPGSGELSLAGGPWRPAFSQPAEAIQHGVCLVSEDRKRQGLVPGVSVKENVALAALERFSRGTMGIDWPRLSKAAEEQCLNMRVKAPSLDAPASSLSGGNQQKLLLGRWLLMRPRVLLLDEPTRGIDVGAKAEIYALIRGLAAQGLAVILASSDLPELLALSHRILVLSQGRLTAELKPDQFSPEAVMHAATA